MRSVVTLQSLHLDQDHCWTCAELRCSRASDCVLFLTAMRNLLLWCPSLLTDDVISHLPLACAVTLLTKSVAPLCGPPRCVT